MTPQQYHLTDGLKYRAAIIKRIANHDAAVEARRKDALTTILKDSGITVPSRYRRESDDGYSRSLTYRTAGFSVCITKRKGPVEKDPAEITKLRGHRQVICKTFTAGGASRFASFVRAKYGKDAPLSTIKKAHGEWLDTLACVC